MPDDTPTQDVYFPPPAALDELDLLRFLHAHEKHARVTAEAINARKEAEAVFRAAEQKGAAACLASAQALDAVLAVMREKYALRDGDVVNDTTGAITRAPAVEAIAVPAVDASPAA